jgi:hypothetical protein
MRKLSASLQLQQSLERELQSIIPHPDSSFLRYYITTFLHLLCPLGSSQILYLKFKNMAPDSADHEMDGKSARTARQSANFIGCRS